MYEVVPLMVQKQMLKTLLCLCKEHGIISEINESDYYLHGSVTHQPLFQQVPSGCIEKLHPLLYKKMKAVDNFYHDPSPSSSI